MKETTGVRSKENEIGKKEYQSPQLVCYGTVAKLTRGAGGRLGDMGGHTRGCWIAEVLYGVDAPRTELIRGWLSECYERRELWSLLVVPLYGWLGERIAVFLRRYPAFQRGFRPLFDLGLERALRDRAALVMPVARKEAASLQV